jgi:hypothetical protein
MGFRWRDLTLGVLAAGLVFGHASAATYDWENCYPNARKAEFPGLAVGTPYSRVRKILPGACQGREARLHGCGFVDKRGYDISFMGDDGPVSGGAFLSEKIASATRHPPLPLGITWSDGMGAVEQKLKTAGYRTFTTRNAAGGDVGVDACLLGRERDGFHFILSFDARGQLKQARQFVDIN